jgi:hypothetical protein
MTTYRVKHNKENPYVKLDKGFLQTPDLSAKAKGILAYLLSLPSDWKICLSHLVKVFSDGEASIRSGLGELKKAGYLTKVAVRDRTGQIVNWVTDVYETPHHFDLRNACQRRKAGMHSGSVADKDCDRNGNFSLVKSPPSCDRDSYRDVDFPQLDNPQLENLHLDNPHLDNRSQQINKDPLRNDLTNPPLPSQPNEREKQLKTSYSESNSQLVDNEPNGSSNFFVVQKALGEDDSSAAASKNFENVKKCEATTPTTVELLPPSEPPKRIKRYDAALGIKEPEDWKNLQQKQFDWVADGPWQLSGKLDPNFVDWLARSWQQEYGGTIHKKRSDVLRHFKKDPANIAIAWEQYNSEHLHRYKNAAVRMENGLEIQADEQQQLLTHARAVANPLPDELNPVASAAEVASLSNVPVFLPETSFLESDGEEGSLTDDGERHLLCRSTPASVPPLYGEATSPSAPPKRAERGGQGLPSHGRHSPSATSALASSSENTLASQTTTETYSFPIRPPAGSNVMTSNSSQSLNPSSIPTDDDGCAQNPGAYQEWKPTPSDDEPVSESAFSTKLAAFTKHLSMSARKQELPKSTESSQLDELNQWLADPILCKEVMTRVMRSERYTVEFDDLGKPMKIVEMKG